GYIAPKYDENGLPDFDSVKAVFRKVEELIKNENIISVWSIAGGGVAEGIFKMSLGNRIGAKLEALTDEELFTPVYGGFVFEIDREENLEGVRIIGETIPEYEIICGDVKLDIAELEDKWNSKLEPIFRNTTPAEKAPEIIAYDQGCDIVCAPANKTAKPKILIPVFPGTNGEYDMADAFNRNGGESEIFVIRNLNAQAMEESVEAFAKLIEKSQIVAIPGGFSGGDEPEGSGKFINAFFRNPRVKDAVNDMLYRRDGLMLGICNGFQALIKLGLVPFGEIKPLSADSPTLTFNTIGRHQSQMVYTKICTDKSPWLMHCKVGETHTVPISHGEGRFVAKEEVIRKLIENGQVATQYVDLNGNPTMELAYNPNGSMYAIEGIISPDGRVLGKMGHSERISDERCAVNVEGNKLQPLFKGGVDY
ncbi:MAG: phosphoribosylformylglycinamidine synthase subunit PurQ, partial [Ruminiclostridium sp.]|nr:phosphoribosylformylglycinamidine synthase subunit PurQ [Ruminiclostridium sp.]